MDFAYSPAASPGRTPTGSHSDQQLPRSADSLQMGRFRLQPSGSLAIIVEAAGRAGRCIRTTAATLTDCYGDAY